jgi:hypothetical protein
MCNSVLLFVSHCFALSWLGRSCKWELVLNWLTLLNKGEIKKYCMWECLMSVLHVVLVNWIFLNCLCHKLILQIEVLCSTTDIFRYYFGKHFGAYNSLSIVIDLVGTVMWSLWWLSLTLGPVFSFLKKKKNVPVLNGMFCQEKMLEYAYNWQLSIERTLTFPKL